VTTRAPVASRFDAAAVRAVAPPGASNRIREDHPDIGAYTAAEVVGHAVAIVSNLMVVGAGVVWLVAHGERLQHVAWVVPCSVVLGLLVADLASGILHWGLDTWFDANTPGLGRMVKTVREHHVYPADVLDYRFRHHAGILSAPALLVAAPIVLPIALLADDPGAAPFGLVLGAIVVSLGILFMFETHKQGHRTRRTRLAGFLGRCHLLLTPDHHLAHHRPPYDFNYCLIGGWADWFMNRFDGWRRLERLVTRVTGAIPREDDRRWCERYLGPGPSGLPEARAPWPLSSGDCSHTSTGSG